MKTTNKVELNADSCCAYKTYRDEIELTLRGSNGSLTDDVVIATMTRADAATFYRDLHNTLVSAKVIRGKRK
jgi:hypothetical protein|tara:strand:- start:246 stop:461 length:216 start_codon:yes stop_codon:yes gene_type:complete